MGSTEFCQGFTGSYESRSEIQFLFRRCLTGKIEILRRCKRHRFTMSCPGGSDDKECAYNAGYLDLVPGSGRSPGERNGNPLQYSCLGNPMDRGTPSMRSRRVGHSWVTNIFPFALFTIMPNPDCCFLSSLGQGCCTWVLFTCGHSGKLPQAMKLWWRAHLIVSLLWDIILILPIVH